MLQFRPELAAKVEGNAAAHAHHLYSHLPGALVRNTDELLIADSGFDHRMFNIVAAARFPADSVSCRVVEAVGVIRATGRRFTWLVGPSGDVENLGALLESSGLTLDVPATAMWRDLAELPVPESPGELDVRLASGGSELDDFAGVIAGMSNPPGLVVLQFFSRVAVGALASDSRYLVGYRHEIPICTAEVFFGSGVAGVYNINTLPGFRRNGYGRTTTAAALQLARSAGYSQAVLTASGMGEPLYRSLGFSSCGQVTGYYT